MPTRTEKIILEIEDQLKEADAIQGKCVPGTPLYMTIRRMIQAQRLTLEVVRGLMPEVNA